MRLLVLVSVLAVAASAVEVSLNYHTSVGIPLAKEIKDREDALFSRRGVDQRIVGGVSAAANAHPYLAGLVISFTNIAGMSVCGSSLLSPNRLVTAAHCWFDGVNLARAFEVVLGSHFLFYGGTRISTSSVVLHSQWTPSSLQNDVAIIYLPVSVTYSTSIQPVALPSTTDLFDTFAGQWSTASGYGKTSDLESGVTIDTSVREVNLQVITVATCQASYGVVFVTASNICTSGLGFVGVCGGDSGGPLVITRNGIRTLIGIASFAASNQCHMGHPSGFARVTSFYNFIIQHL